jgi:SulP family sulfate permease
VVIDLRRVTGVDSSAVASFAKVLRLAEGAGSEVIVTGASEPVRAQLHRGGVGETPGLLRFEPDLDRGLQRVEDALLEGAMDVEPGGGAEIPAGLSGHFERSVLEVGTTLLSQGEAPDDVFVLESGRLRVQLVTPEGTQIRVATVRPGVVIGEIALYTGATRTAEVIAEEPSVVLRLRREAIARIEGQEPELAVLLHRWFASTLAGRMADRIRTLDALLD